MHVGGCGTLTLNPSFLSAWGSQTKAATAAVVASKSSKNKDNKQLGSIVYDYESALVQ